ncbi:hypothetical protein BHE74_00055598, partial [Ensete ventricosum]
MQGLQYRTGGTYQSARPLTGTRIAHYRTIPPIAAVSIPLPPEIGRWYQPREKEEEGEEKGEPGDSTLLSRSRSVAYRQCLLPTRGEKNVSPRDEA